MSRKIRDVEQACQSGAFVKEYLLKNEFIKLRIPLSLKLFKGRILSTIISILRVDNVYLEKEQGIWQSKFYQKISVIILATADWKGMSFPTVKIP